MRKPELYYRDPDLVIAIIAALETFNQPAPLNHLIATITTHDHTNTERTIRALTELGATQICGKYQRDNDTRTVRLTPLGIAWLNQEHLPHVDDDHQWTRLDNDNDLTG